MTQEEEKTVDIGPTIVDNTDVEKKDDISEKEDVDVSPPESVPDDTIFEELVKQAHAKCVVPLNEKTFEELVKQAHETCVISPNEKKLILGYKIYDENVLDEIESMIDLSIETNDRNLLIGAIEFVTEIRESIADIENASSDAVDIFKNAMRKKFERAFTKYREDNKELMGDDFDDGDMRSHNLISYLMCVGMKRATEESKHKSQKTSIMTHSVRGFRSSLKDIHYTINSRNNYYMGDDGKVKITNLNALIGLTSMYDQFLTGTRLYEIEHIKHDIAPNRVIDKDKLSYPILTNFDRLEWLSDDSINKLVDHNRNVSKYIRKNLEEKHYDDVDSIHKFAIYNNNVLKNYISEIDRYIKNINVNMNRKFNENKKLANTPKGVSMIADKLFSEGFIRSVLRLIVGNKLIQDVDDENILPFDKDGTPNPLLNDNFRTSNSDKLNMSMMKMIYDLPSIFNTGVFFKELKYYLERYVKKELTINSSDKIEDTDIAQYTILQDMATIISLHISYGVDSKESVISHMTRYFSSGRVLTDVPSDYFKFYKPKEANEDLLKYWMEFRTQQTKIITDMIRDEPSKYKNVMTGETRKRHNKMKFNK